MIPPRTDDQITEDSKGRVFVSQNRSKGPKAGATVKLIRLSSGNKDGSRMGCGHEKASCFISSLM